MKSNAVGRLRFLALVIILVAVLYVIRLFFIQVVEADYYHNLGDRQYLQPSSNIFDRGNIYFTWKNNDLFSAATLKLGFILAVNPKLITNAEADYQKLSTLLTLNHDDFIKKATKTDDTYEEIATKIDQTTADKINTLKLKGVSLYKERWRSYPLGSTAAQTLGLLGYEGDNYTGTYGLEKYYNNILSRGQEMTFVNFFAEMFSGVGKAITGAQDDSEGDIVTTIEPQVQQYFESQLNQARDKWQADQAGGIIMNPQTGEIYALAAFPNFNPDEKQTDLNVLANPLVERVYEMGSIMKPLTMAAGLDAGVITASSTYDDTGTIVLNGKKISNYDFRARGVIPMQQILSQSLNVGASFISQKLGHDRFRSYFLNYGLGEKTGIDLPNEIHGLVNNLSSPRDVEYATASFGQGIAVTPIEMIRALAVLANGGYLVRPYLVREIDYKNKLVRKIAPVKIRQVIKKTTSDEVTNMLINVVDQALANGGISLPHYSMAAKTGTAQMADPAGGYYPNRYLHSFFGYFPARNPRFIIFMYLVYPKGVQYASETLTDSFSNMAKFLLNYYQVPPDR